MQVLSLEIRRNNCGYPLTMLGQENVRPGAIVGQVKLGGDGAEIVTPLSPAQIDAVLGAIAHTAANAANTLASAVSAASFMSRPALEHAPDPLEGTAFEVPPPAPAPVVVSLEQPLADMVAAYARTADPIEAADPLRLPLVVGGVYETRGGEMARVTRILTGQESGDYMTNYPVTFTLDDGEDVGESCTREGAYYSTGEVHRLDLVKRLTDDARTTTLTEGRLAEPVPAAAELEAQAMADQVASENTAEASDDVVF